MATNQDPVPEQQSGKLVAIEGDTDIISTQLRLLPPSQKILILQSIHESLPKETEQDVFDSRSYVRNVHAAFTQRIDAARSFLRPSTNTQPRLVFMNGGSVSARATCIDKIAEKVTNGHILKAEAIFNETVKFGVAGLRHEADAVEQDVLKEDVASDEILDKQDVAMDPSSRAMKAAESLDQETAVLQPEEIVDDTTVVVSHPGIERSSSTGTIKVQLAEPTASWDATETELQQRTESSSAQKVILTSPEGDEILETVLTIPHKYYIDEKRLSCGLRPPSTAPLQSRGDIRWRSQDADDAECDESGLGSLGRSGVEFGEACIVNVSSRSRIRRASSSDIYARDKNARDFLRVLRPVPVWTPSHRPIRPSASAHQLRKNAESLRTMKTISYHSFPAPPKTTPATFVRAAPTFIRKSSSSGESGKLSSSSNDPLPRLFVDRGVDAGEISVKVPVPDEGTGEPFIPVFPVEEDFILQLYDGKTNEVLGSVMRSYKDGSYPIIPQTFAEPSLSLSEEGDLSTRLVSVISEDTDRNPRRLEIEADNVGHCSRDEFDPYASRNGVLPPMKLERKWLPPPNPRFNKDGNITSSIGPPTPSMTPPSAPANAIAERFHEFSASQSSNAITLQNSLRQLLSVHFPASEYGYSQYYFSVAPEMERLWKPVFRNDNDTTKGIEGRNVDQIIAMGCEQGVAPEFFHQLSGQIEKLGIKRDGNNRSGKLDVRFLIANTMQGISGPPPATKNSVDLLSNPNLLATVLVPQIEAYLACHASTRLLVLNYQPCHLETVFALRKLLGPELFKVAGVLDALSSDPSTRLHTPSPTVNPLSDAAVASRNRHTRLHPIKTSSLTSALRSSETLPNSPRSIRTRGLSNAFSKANFLLPSTATDAEVAIFLSSIWKSLMEKSAFYTPEPEPKPVIIEAPPMPPTPISALRDLDYRPSSSDQGPSSAGQDSGFSHTPKSALQERDSEPEERLSPSLYSGQASKVSRLIGNHNAGHELNAGTSSHRTKTTSRVENDNYHDVVSIASTAHHTATDSRGYPLSTTTSAYTAKTERTRGHKYAESVATMRTTKTTMTERERQKDWENFYVGEDDSDDDAYDRMILGREMARIVPEQPLANGQKRNTKKALKWLGLA